MFSDVWNEHAALFEGLMEIHSNPPILVALIATEDSKKRDLNSTAFMIKAKAQFDSILSETSDCASQGKDSLIVCLFIHWKGIQLPCDKMYNILGSVYLQ